MNFIFVIYIHIYIFNVYDSRKYCVWQVIAVALPVMKRFEPYKKCIQNCLKPYSTLKNIKILLYAFN